MFVEPSRLNKRNLSKGGLEVDTRAYFTVVTMMISLPTGTKVFNWLSTFIGNWCTISIIILSYGIFIIIFLSMFTFGGSTGVILSNGTIDVTMHDTYYVIGHFHYVLSLGAIIGLLLGMLFYQDIILKAWECSIIFLTLDIGFLADKYWLK